ncbi:glycosyltransferase family 39 protein, partial [Candidatus Woesebacteria bacterium]|nr:glycosyltransferase family 39 protein [Candidatus Woesebacteria bacterium]
GHPPLSDIISSVFNRVLFGHLRLVNDVDSYRVYGVLLSSLLVGLVFYWSSEKYGKLAGFVSALVLAMYPLFFAESHFNTEKDVPEIVYWSFFLFAVWKGFTQKKSGWIILSGLFFGLALGTKFNILFSVLIIVPWIFVYLGRNLLDIKYLKIMLTGLIAFLIGIIVFYGTWPYLWQDLITGTQRVIGFYKEIGTTSGFDIRYLGPFKTNTYPTIWIIYTTPIFVLLLTAIGAVSTIVNFKKDKTKIGLLFVLWMTVPIARVSLPNTNIYGGIRQIMEYIPAMAMLSGIGAAWIVKHFNNQIFKKTFFVVLIFCFISLGIHLYKIHPNENAYFNPLIGGLTGAKAKNIPSWGNTFGGGYRQAISWVNENAEKNANLVFAHELMPNIPPIWVRQDISFHNSERSGFLRKGEYVVSLTYEGTIGASYFDAYSENFLNPVYTSDVDGVSIVKVWKNDVEHTKDQYKTQSRVGNTRWQKTKDGVLIDLGSSYFLSHLILDFSEKGCDKVKFGKMLLSNDGINWNTLPEVLPTGAVPIVGEQPLDGKLYFPFLADKAKFINIKVEPSRSCLSNTSAVSVYSFPDIKI